MHQRGLTQQQLAEAIGTSQTTIHKLCSGKSKETRKLSSIARFLQVSSDWLATGEGFEPDLPISSTIPATSSARPSVVLEGFPLWESSEQELPKGIELSIYQEVSLETPEGCNTVIQEVAGQKLLFSPSILDTAKVSSVNAACVIASSNNMEPLIMNGAPLAIDRGATQVLDGEIYALEQDGIIRIHQLYHQPKGAIRLHSFNQTEHPDLFYSLKEQQELRLRILGRVFWWSNIRPSRPKITLNKTTDA